MKLTYVSLFAILLVLTSGIPLFSGPGVINNASGKYAPANTQTQANSNECDTGTNCGITSPQTQGDGTANSPTNLQISKFNEEEEGQGNGGGGVEGPLPPSVILQQVRVFKQVICPQEFVCPTPDKFTMKVEVLGDPTASVLPDQFPGSSETSRPDSGTHVIITTSNFLTTYRVNEVDIPPTPEGLSLSVRQSEGCQGRVEGDPKICTFTNEYTIPAIILVEKKVICPQEFVCPTPDKFRMQVLAGVGTQPIDPQLFFASDKPTPVQIKFVTTPSTVSYRVNEVDVPPAPEGLTLDAQKSAECQGTISYTGQVLPVRRCTITNEYIMPPIPPP